MTRLPDWLRPLLRVDIICPHGQFVPATYRAGDSGHRLSCDDCGFKIQLRWINSRRF